MKFTILLLLLLQFGPRAPLTPAETLLAPDVLREIERTPTRRLGERVVVGVEPGAGEIAVVCGEFCEPAEIALDKIASSVAEKRIPRPVRAIRLVTVESPRADTKAALFIAPSTNRTLQVVRGLWSTASIVDEVVDIFAHYVADDDVNSHQYEYFGQPRWESRGIPVTTIVPQSSADTLDRASSITAASAYFLATLPNAGSEALLSHLTVGAHARLAEDGRKAVAQMGPQQRASADVLIMLGQAIEREQRRMRSFERYMPAPVDPMLHSRILDMEKGITGVWTSMGITSSPYVAPAERIRGRGGEDRRVPSRANADPVIKPVEPPTAFLKFDRPDVIVYELHNFIDGKRSISDIRDAVSAEFGPLPLPSVVDYFERLAKSVAITLK